MGIESDSWPAYCCAILRDAAGRYLLEQRPLHETAAPGKLVCFGGGREQHEHPDACIRRELVEELGFHAAQVERCVVLRSNRRVIAWFYRGAAPSPESIVTEAGVTAVWHAWEELASLPLGGWHVAALRAEREGAAEAIVNE